MNFKDLQTKLIDFGKSHDACSGEFRKLENAETIADLLEVVTDNFAWVSSRASVAELLIGVADEDLALARIYVSGSHSVSDGNSFASGSATVRAWGSATVRAWDSATVEASDSATVEASDSATVRAWDSATVEAWGSATVRASGSATVRAWGSATVRAWGSAFASVYSADKLIISEKAIGRIRSTDTVVFTSEMALQK